MLVVGTRPECIKIAPLAIAMASHSELRPVLVNSGQHQDAVRRTLAEFGLRSDFELASIPSLPHLAAAHDHARCELRELFARFRPAIVFVQGDTLTAYSAARAAADGGFPVAHVEAGLRTDSIAEPFPEEWFRRRIARHADIHFAPTHAAVRNLVAEGIDPGDVHRVGNTGIDALKALLDGSAARAPRVRDTLLVTLHRRENYDRNAAIVCDALLELAAARHELRIVFPVHPNPRVSTMIRRKLGAHAAISLVEPMSYRDFIECAARAALIISDSGGVQEEAPHLGTPLLVPRCNTERPECLATGFVALVPVDCATIVRTAMGALDLPRRPALPIDDSAPFGAGDAASRIVSIVERFVLRRAVA